MTYLEGRILYLKAQIDFQLASVTSGHCLSKTIYREELLSEITPNDRVNIDSITTNLKGETWVEVELTDQERIEVTMGVAKHLIEQLFKAIEALNVG